MHRCKHAPLGKKMPASNTAAAAPTGETTGYFRDWRQQARDAAVERVLATLGDRSRLSRHQAGVGAAGPEPPIASPMTVSRSMLTSAALQKAWSRTFRSPK